LAYLGLGVAYGRLARWEEAIAVYKNLILIRPDYTAKAYLSLGVAYDAIGHIEEAIDVYKEVIKIKPDDEIPYLGLGVAYVRLARW